MAFFNASSLFLHDAMYKTAICIKRWSDLDQHKENPSKLKTENGGISHIGMTKPPIEAPFFLFGGLIQPILYKERANELQVTSQIHRLCVCASGSLMIVTFNC